MTFIIFLALNALFGVCVFLYFRERFHKMTQADEIKRELASVIHAFNTQADAQITVLEDHLKRAEQVQKALDHRIFELKRLGGISSHVEEPPPSPAQPPVETPPAQPVIRAKVKDLTVKESQAPGKPRLSRELSPQKSNGSAWVERDYLVEVDEGDRLEREREERLVETLRRLEEEKISRAPLSEKVRFFYHRRGQSAREIGKKLGLSLTEIEMILQEPIGE